MKKFIDEPIKSQTVEAEIDEHGVVKLKESVAFKQIQKRVFITFFEEPEVIVKRDTEFLPFKRRLKQAKNLPFKQRTMNIEC